VARDTEALTVAYVVPLAPLANGRYVVSLGLLGATANTTAFPARPSISRQHSLPPRSVSPAAIPTGCRVWAGALVSLAGGTQTQRPVDWDAGGHYDFITIDTVAVAFVLAATSLTYGTAYAASGRAYIVWFVVLGASVIDATAPSEPYS
jgi:hypothetical protein